MSSNSAQLERAAGGSESTTLDRSLGLRRVVFQSVAVMGPGASIVFGLGLIITYAGPASPVAMVVALAAVLCVATAMGQLGTRIASAGGLYSYASVALSPTIGFLLGWMYVGMALIFPTVGAVLFGIVGKDFCNSYLGFDPPWWALGLIAALVPAVFTYLGVRLSTSVSLVLGAIEVTILTVVCILLAIHAGGANTFSVFNPSRAAQSGESTARLVFLGVIYAAATFTGFESSVQLGEEARDPTRTVPRAVLLATGIIGLFYVFAMYVAVVSWGPAHLSGFVASSDAWRVLADKLGSVFGFFVVLAILNSTFALTQASYTATTRLIYGMARNGALPSPLARLHQTHRTPYVAAISTAALVIGVMFLTNALFDGPFPAFVYMITIITIVFLVFYVLTALGCIVYFGARRRDLLKPVIHLVLPALGGAVFAVALYYSFKGLEYPATWAPISVAAWFVIGLAAVAVLKAKRTDLGREARRWLEADPNRMEAEA